MVRLFVRVLLGLFVILSFHSCHGQKIDKNGKLVTNKPQPAKGKGKGTVAPSKAKAKGQTQQGEYYDEEYEDEEFCYGSVRYPFYQRSSDGAVCCRGKELPVITLTPETKGPCAINTKTDKNGILDSTSLWCSYTCSLKKMGIIDGSGSVVADKFFDHLTKGLTPASKDRMKSIMKDYLKCYKPLRNVAKPCYTPLSFHKCYQDALVFLCSAGLPKNGNYTGFAKVTAVYDKMEPYCYYNKRKVMPGCCHGKPLPWTITELLEAPSNATKMNSCLQEMGSECDATCLLKSMDVVNDELELDVDKFSKLILKHFPTVGVSSWMDFTGPVFLFYDEVLVDMGDEASDAVQRVCRFHDRVMELHESKIEQYCAMSAEEVKELVQAK